MANPQPDQFFKFSTELWWAWTKFQMPAHVAKVCQVVIGMTYGFHRKEAEVSLQQFQRYGQINDKSNIGRALRKAVKMNLLVRRDHGNKVTYRFQKDYEKWKPWSPETTMVPRDHNHGPTGPKSGWKPKPTKAPPTLKDNLKINTTESKKQDSDLFIIESYFKKVHLDEWGESYRVDFARDRKLINQLLRNYSTDKLIKMIDRLASLVIGPDKFYSEFSIPRLSQHQAKLLQDISKKSPLDDLPSYTKEQMEDIDRKKRE